MEYQGLNIYIEGVGQPLLLLHGWGVDHKMMEPLFQHFKTKYRVCNLDLPGFGQSKDPQFPYSIYDYVHVIKEVVRAYDLQHPIIIAHSFGARIAFHYAAMWPVQQLIVSGGAGIRPLRNFDYYFQIYLFKCLRFLHIQNNLGSEDYQKANEVMRRTLVKVVNEDASADIMKITCPILLVWGDKDTQTPLWMAKKIVSLNDHATLVTFKGDDHFAYYHQMQRFILVCEHVMKEGV